MAANTKSAWTPTFSQSQKVDCGCMGGRTYKHSAVRPKLNFQKSSDSNQISQTPLSSFLSSTGVKVVAKSFIISRFALTRKHYKKCLKWQVEVSLPTFLLIDIEFQLPIQKKARKQSFILFSSEGSNRGDITFSFRQIRGKAEGKILVV